MSASPLPIARPALGEEEVAAAARAIRSGWITQGPEVAAFEAEFAAYVGGAPTEAVAVSNCTTALHLALRALGVGDGDEVLCPSHSFIASANAIRHAGAIPVFVDVEARTYNLDPGLLEGAVSPRVKAIMVVHQLGMPANLAPILAFARKRALKVIEDAACAIGSTIDLGAGFERIGRPHGDIACFSFHPRKVLTTGDGGMITTGDAEVAGWLRRVRQHAMSVSDRERHASKGVVFETYDELGYNYRMTDIQAAIGREQLKKLPAMVERRRALAALYREHLASVPGLLLPLEPPWARSNWQTFCVRLPSAADQRPVMTRLLEQGIATRRAVMNAHRERAFGDGGEPFRKGSELSEGERIQDSGVVLPLFDGMTEDDVRRVAVALRGALDG